jgi:mannose-6-phosphate isomerase-like protein (cupin superfamily)
MTTPITPDFDVVRFGDIRKGLEAADGRAFVGLRHGTMRVLLYAPQETDDQTPHKQDELYIIQSGHGQFRKGEAVASCGPGDVIFVEAGAAHRFEHFSADFAAWAVFWGPEGGEI